MAECDLQGALNLLADAYDAKNLAQEDLSAAEWAKYRAGEKLDDREMELSETGCVEGSNDKARQKSLRFQTKPERKEKDDATFQHIMFTREHKIATNEVRYLERVMDILMRV